MQIKYENIRKEVMEAGVKMANSHLVVGTWGNVSERIPGEDLMAITPSGMDYDTIKVEDIVIMDFNGKVIDGDRVPSIEFGLHGAIYKTRSDINAVVHTHSEYCTAMAMARKPIPAAAEDLVQIVGGDVRVAEYALPGTKELGDAAVKAMEGRNAAILANHGCVAAAKDLKETLKAAAIVEKTAKETLFAKLYGGVVELQQDEIDSMRNFYLNKYGQKR